jgi:hypothetical protein
VPRPPRPAARGADRRRLRERPHERNRGGVRTPRVCAGHAAPMLRTGSRACRIRTTAATHRIGRRRRPGGGRIGGLSRRPAPFRPDDLVGSEGSRRPRSLSRRGGSGSSRPHPRRTAGPFAAASSRRPDTAPDAGFRDPHGRRLLSAQGRARLLPSAVPLTPPPQRLQPVGGVPMIAFLLSRRRKGELP